MDRNDYARIGIDVMTAWAADPDSAQFSAERVVHYAGPDGDGAADVILGLINLASYLLVKRFGETGISELRTLQEYAATLD